ncbi:MAG TPA: M13 family metallopeptidase N-terminal domain-containing protein, partial [Candidatus Elarobacter sp.]|nr:M13 family metallopeptidase N-terminal domain-containing protein [Candidatus Elarobacter sp.]
MPADRTNWARFVKLSQDNQNVVRGIVEESAAAHAVPGSNTQKVGDFYGSCTNMSVRNSAGISPVKSLLDRIDATAAADLPVTLAQLHGLFVGGFFNAGSRVDLRDADATIIGIGQGGLGLGDRDFYLKDDAKSQAIRDAYVKHVGNELVLSGWDDARSRAAATHVMALETAIAKLSRDRVALRDPKLNYHKTDLAGVTAAAPGFAWDRYFAARTLPATTAPINLSNADYARDVVALMNAAPLDDVKTYLRWHVLNAFDTTLSQPFDDEAFAFAS